MPRKPEFIMPTDDEDARINQGIALDADNPELTSEDFLRTQVARQVPPLPRQRAPGARATEGSHQDARINAA